MGRFLKEYSGTNWIAWLILFCILAIPFFWGKARAQSIVWHQMLNVFLAFFAGLLISGTGRMTSNDALGMAVFYGFGVGYSLLALRKPSTFERIVAVVCLLFFGSMTATMVLKGWRQM